MNFPGTLGREGGGGVANKYRPYNLDKQQGQDVLFIKPIKHTNVSNVSIMQSPSYHFKRQMGWRVVPLLHYGSSEMTLRLSDVLNPKTN